jgi:hypothetical protein
LVGFGEEILVVANLEDGVRRVEYGVGIIIG